MPGENQRGRSASEILLQVARAPRGTLGRRRSRTRDQHQEVSARESESRKLPGMPKMSSREKTLEAVQKILSVRGYVVFGIKPGRSTRYRIGEIRMRINSTGLSPTKSVGSRARMRFKRSGVSECHLTGSNALFGVSEGLAGI
jgi:hypothetical protein